MNEHRTRAGQSILRGARQALNHARKDPAMAGSGKERLHGDFYPTPPWCVHCAFDLFPLAEGYTWEPACGDGRMVKALSREQYQLKLIATDLHDRGYGKSGVDFLKQKRTLRGARNIITNPPYTKAEEFVRHAIKLVVNEHVRGCVAMFLRNEWDSAKTRRDLYDDPSIFFGKIAMLNRPRWFPKEDGDSSPRHNYAWYLWSWRPDATHSYLWHRGIDDANS